MHVSVCSKHGLRRSNGTKQFKNDVVTQSKARARLVFAALFRLEPSPSRVESDSSLEPARAGSARLESDSTRLES